MKAKQLATRADNRLQMGYPSLLANMLFRRSKIMSRRDPITSWRSCGNTPPGLKMGQSGKSRTDEHRSIGGTP
jgi:hypothetical protein